jgi:hypothetical protein
LTPRGAKFRCIDQEAPNAKQITIILHRSPSMKTSYQENAGKPRTYLTGAVRQKKDSGSAR